MTPYFQGMTLGGGLIIAIGAQNAFLLTQGVRNNHPFAVALLCILCDGIFMGLGVTGVGAAVASSPILGQIALWGGALFLGWYGFSSFLSAYRGGKLELTATQNLPLRKTLMMALAVTLLNPHFYLDTVVLMGSISGQYAVPERYWFGVGAFSSSVCWFLFLAAFSRIVAPLFKKESTWRVLDISIGCTMWYLAWTLIK